jgi:hypothetical protein
MRTDSARKHCEWGRLLTTRLNFSGVYLPKRVSEVTVCHYGSFHGHEKHTELGLYDPDNRDRLCISPKTPKVLGVRSMHDGPWFV